MFQGEYIDDPKLYLNVMVDHKKIKVMEEVIEVQIDGSSITLYDISLHKKGPMEDKLYVKNPFYLANVRRGNTISFHNYEYRFCRRGLRKFYDLEKSYIENAMMDQGAQKLIGFH